MKEDLLATTLKTPLGTVTLTATDRGLAGLHFENHQPAPDVEATRGDPDDSRFLAAKAWLVRYFTAKTRPALPSLDLAGGTDFQRRVWETLCEIPDGETVTYRDLAMQIGSPKAVRAVGAAVGRNPISILIPCHRVLGSDGSLTGFAGGLERKRWLLVHEGILVL